MRTSNPVNAGSGLRLPALGERVASLIHKTVCGSLVVFFCLCSVSGNVHAQVTQRWVSTYDGPAHGNDLAFAMALDAQVNIYVTGYSTGVGTGRDYATLKFDPDTGDQLWIARYDGPAHGEDDANAIAVDAAGSVFVTGQSLSVRSTFEYATVKYDGLTGDQLWVARYQGPGSADAARAIAVDGDGNVFVTGESWGFISRPEYATLKYDGATGVQLWEARYVGIGVGNNWVKAMALDNLGNAYVTGQSDDATGFPEYATVKYDGVTGAQLWIARYRNLPGTNDAATAIAFDPAGSVYVTGQSFGVDTLSDYATVKYDALTGDQLWVARYDGPTHGQDTGKAVAIDTDGNVFVTGSSEGPGSIRQYATVKYDGVTGDQVWVARYADPMGGHAQPTAMALDGTGNAYVTGQSSDYGATVKYDGATGGDPLWAVAFRGPVQTASPSAIAVDALVNVYVAGSMLSAAFDYDYATIKYSQP